VMLTDTLGVIWTGQSRWRFSIVYSCTSDSAILGIEITVVAHRGVRSHRSQGTDSGRSVLALRFSNILFYQAIPTDSGVGKLQGSKSFEQLQTFQTDLDC
jgi:hypothetical protein